MESLLFTDIGSHLLSSTILIVLIGMGFLAKGWIKHVNIKLESMDNKFDALAKSREDKWDEQGVLCRTQEGRISKIEGAVGIKTSAANLLRGIKE